MELWVGALNLGFLYAFMTMGVFFTFRIHDFPDITVDGSFTAGAAASAVLIISGVNPFLALVAAFLIGTVAGTTTAYIHTRLNINGLLAGILVMTALYSINLHIMGRSNIPLLNQVTFFSYLERINPGLPDEIYTLIALSIVMALFWFIISLFLKTDLGIAMRATGNNPIMSAATGVNVDRMKIFGVALANGLVGISGGLVAQYQGFADIGMGIGTIVIGLAAVIIGESLLKTRSLYVKTFSVILGSVIFRFMIAVALYVGLNPLDLKLLTAFFVLIALIIPKILSGKKTGSLESLRQKTRAFSSRKFQYGLVCVLIVTAVLLFVYQRFRSTLPRSSKVYKIGVVQLTDNGLLNITRDSFVKEMERIGYRSGENCVMMIENANGDLPTVNTILDKFLQEKVDVIVPISTGCTQAALNKTKNLPVVFATVANPFIIGAGASETDHLPNVTGVYGWAPMDRTMEMVRQILPGKLTVGAIWDPAQANSVFNVTNLKKAIESYDGVTLQGATITNSSEVYEAATSLVQRGVNVFVLCPDNIVYSAFESVVKAARKKNIPIFISDVERLADGALVALGYDYTISGIQAAHLVDRVLKGGNPKDIPFERYSKLSFGINLDVAQATGITIPSGLIAKATICYRKIDAVSEALVKRADQIVDSSKRPSLNAQGPGKRLALFLFSDNYLLRECAKGVTEELERCGILRRQNISVDSKNAQNEFYMAQSIAQDIVRQKYDYIITISTPALQVMANTNKKIPHVFGAVTDPYRMGVAKNSRDHLPNVTGVATFQPVATTIRVMRELFPNAQRIGIVWNPSEACSEACTYKARDAAKLFNFELVEITVSSTGEVMDALKAVVNKKVDLFLTSGDNTVIMTLPSIAELLKRHRIPYFTNTPSDVELGALVSIGADYIEVGKATAQMAERVINGEDPQKIPINDYVPEKMYVNQALAREYGINLPAPFLKRASRVLR